MPNNKLRIQDAANYLGVSAKTLRRWEKSKKLIPERSDGGQRYYDLQILNEHLKKNNGVITNKSLDINHGISSVSKWLLATSSFVFIFFFGLYKFQEHKNNSLTSNVSKPSVLAASTGTNGVSQKYTFTVNVPAKFNDSVTFTKDIEAPNLVTSVNGSTGEVNVDFELTAGTGISVDGLKVTNSGIVSLTAGDGISVSGSTITNTGIKSLEAGSGISISGNTITNTYTFTPDYSLSGWTDGGTTVGLSTITDSVVVDTITYGNATVTNGHSIVPDTDLGSDIGSSLYRFNNLWVGTINSNSSQGFSGQTTFSYPPTSTAITEASVLINPTTSFDNGQLLGLGIAGYQRALIDEDGDLILGYADQISAPTSDYPLNIYGHSGTRVAFVDTTGNGYFSGNVGIGTTSPLSHLDVYGGAGGYSQIKMSADSFGHTATDGLDILLDANGVSFINRENLATRFYVNGAERMRIQPTGDVGIGTTNPSQALEVAGNIRIQNNGYIYGGGNAYINMDNTAGLTVGFNGVSQKIVLQNGAHNDILFTTASTERMRITDAGLVGIGTTAPTGKLHVSGAVTGKALAIFDETGNQNILTASASGVTKLIVNNSGYLGIGTTTPAYRIDLGLDAGVSAIRGYGFKLGIVGSDTHIGQINYIYGNSGVGRISFYESQSAISIQSFNNSTARNVIQIVGATGPNSYNHPQSTNPTLFVHSETGSTTATDQWISFSHDQTNGLISTGKGSLILSPFAKVGIGISNPGYNLDIDGGNNSGLTTQIKGTYHNGLTLTSGGDSYQNLLSFNQTTDWAMGVMGNVYGPDFVLYTNYLSPALLIDSATNNVGIGTTNPGSILDIQAATGKLSLTSTTGTNFAYSQFTNTGDSLYVGINRSNVGGLSVGALGYAGIINVAGAHALQFGTNNTIQMTMDTSGNVGIGTTNPGAKLDVAGNIRLLGSSSGSVAFAAATSGSSVTYTLPSEDGTEGQVLSTNGLGTLSWVDAGTATASASTGTSVSFDISATAITPGNAFASTSYWTTPPSRAFDLVLDTVDNGWINDGGTTGYIGYDFGVQTFVNKYTVYPFSNGGSMDRNPKDWVFESSNNNVDWTTLDTQVNQTSWTFPVSNIYLISNSTAYRYYRLRFTANNGNGYTAIAELKLFSTLNTGTQWTTTGSNIYFSTGNVGVGENAPISKLHVTGAVKGKALAIFDETGDQNIITASSSGITKLTVAKNGLVNASVGGLATFSKAGTISDVDFSDTAVDGLMGFDSTNGRLYIRNGGVWSYIAKTAGFQIPDYESVGLSEGDLLLPYVEKKMEDGAIHGLYTKLEDSKPIIDINSKFSFILNAIDTINTKIAEIKTKIDSLTNEIFTNKSHQETLCVGPKDAETCIDKNQLDSILNSLATPSASPVSESPVPTATSSPLPSPEITENTPVEVTASPSASPTP